MQWHDACKECPRMKMRLQIASMLPAPAKLEPGGSNGKGVFGATFQEMMGTSGSAGAGLGVMGQAWSGRQAQMGAPFTKLGAGKAIDESADEAGLASEAVQTGTVFRGTPKLTDQSEAIGGRIVPQTGTEGAPLAKEPATEPAVRDPTVGQPNVPNSGAHAAACDAGTKRTTGCTNHYRRGVTSLCFEQGCVTTRNTQSRGDARWNPCCR